MSKVYPKLSRYLVTITTPAGPYEVEVPSYGTPEAAGRRALFGVAARYERQTDLETMEVTSVEVIDDE